MYLSKIGLSTNVRRRVIEGRIEYDVSKLGGTFRKLMNVEGLKRLGWVAQIQLHEGLSSTYKWFIDDQGHFRK